MESQSVSTAMEAVEKENIFVTSKKKTITNLAV